MTDINIWWVIFWGGVGTFLMRSVGAWVNPNYVKFRWLSHLPFAVILVMTVSSIYGLQGTVQESIGAIAASLTVIVASWKNLPLFGCVALGCGVFGFVTSVL